MGLRDRIRAASLALAIIVMGGVTPARAEGPYEGDWRTGPMRIEVSIESWGGDCGPRPQSTTVPGGSTIRVTQSGDDLTFQGRPARSTRGCWSENTAVRRVSSSYQSGTWRIVCRTPDDDPRAETGQYTLQAVGTDRIEFRDVSQYDWQLNDSRCRATITSTQTFERIATAVVAPTPEPTPTAPAEPACTPGAPARIVLRPAETTLEPGGRVCMQTRVVDANGCTVRGRSPQLELRTPPGATGRLRSGCFEAAASAAEGEGEFTLVARDGSLEARATVTVRTPDLSDLIARRAEGGGAIAQGEDETTSEEAARLAARTESATRGGTPIWLLAGAGVGLLLVLAATLGLVIVGRRRSAREARSARESAPSDAPSAVAEAPAVAPSSGTGAPSGTPAPAPVQPPGEPKICPTCRRGHPPDAVRCSVDGTPLVTYAEFASGRAGGGERTCPACGTRYPATTRFCGKDGTTLE